MAKKEQEQEQEQVVAQTGAVNVAAVAVNAAEAQEQSSTQVEVKATEEVKKNVNASDGAVYKSITSHIDTTYGDRLRNGTGVKDYRYGKATAKQKGATYALVYGGVTYKFQEGMITDILEEHFEGVVDILEDRLKAEGAQSAEELDKN